MSASQETNNEKYETENEKFDLMEKDWDNLIILDACRYDYFKKTYKNISLESLRK